MVKSRVIIVDEDKNYIQPLLLKFVNEFHSSIDIEIITDKECFYQIFEKPQKAEILIISDQFYNNSIQKHNISNIFVMMEQYEEGGTEELNIDRLFKYTSIKEIFNIIISKSESVLDKKNINKKETQIILVTSLAGGVGKTTIAMGVSSCLTKNFKRVLYINASNLQCFQYVLNNQTPISSSDVYTKLLNPNDNVYSEIKHTIRNEIFSYLPAFKTSLMSIGVDFSIYEKIALSAKKSNEYDFIIIDAESTFDEYKTRLIDISDKVLVVLDQSENSVKSTNLFISNINGVNSDKYVFICNKFKKDIYNALLTHNTVNKFIVNEYIGYIDVDISLKCEVLSKNNDIRKVSFLVV